MLLAIAVAVNYVRRCSPALVATLKHRRNFYCGNAPAAYLISGLLRSGMESFRVIRLEKEVQLPLIGKR